MPVGAASVALHVVMQVCGGCADLADCAHSLWPRAEPMLSVLCRGFAVRAHAWIFRAPPRP